MVGLEESPARAIADLQEDRLDAAETALAQASYIDDTITAAGLSLEALRMETLRTEAGLPVVGCIAVARSP
jgi:hypothetical protein